MRDDDAAKCLALAEQGSGSFNHAQGISLKSCQLKTDNSVISKYLLPFIDTKVSIIKRPNAQGIPTLSQLLGGVANPHNGEL